MRMRALPTVVAGAVLLLALPAGGLVDLPQAEVEVADPGLPVELPRVAVGLPLGSVVVGPRVLPEPPAPAADMGSPPEAARGTVAREAAQGVALGGILLGMAAALARALGLFPVAPLFSRIEQETVLTNPVRRQVLDCIAQEPGITIQELRRRTGVAWGTAVHHLLRLERHGLAVSHRSGGSRRYFPANTRESRSRKAISAIAHPTTNRIARLVAERPGIDQKGICGELGIRNPAASKHLRRLAREGLVASRKVARSCLYEPTPALSEALTLTPAGIALEAVPVDAALAATATSQGEAAALQA
jgi:predicted transcriptional regulator